jgi:monothiol glutaredoxin
MTNDEIRDFLKQAIEEHEVMLFMKGSPEAPRCGFSARTAGALNELGVGYAALDILPDPRIREELSALSGWPTIPQLFVRGKLVGGCDIVTEMYESGELAELLGVEQPEEAELEPQAAQPQSGPLAPAAAALVDERAPALGVLARPLLVALLLLRRHLLPALVGHHRDRVEAASAARGLPDDERAGHQERPVAGVPNRPLRAAGGRSASRYSRYSKMRCESWMTSSPWTSTGTQRWRVSSSISGRSRLR